jgi:hypothetical protein
MIVRTVPQRIPARLRSLAGIRGSVYAMANVTVTLA